MGILFIAYPLAVMHSQVLRADVSVFVTANLYFVCYAGLAWLEKGSVMPPPPIVPMR